MANKHVKIAEDGTLTYTVAEGFAASFPLSLVLANEALNKQVVVFALTHMFRNATAGKMEKPADALKPILTRIEALKNGLFRAHREAGEGGESEHSQLARALAAVMGNAPADAAAFIVEQVNAALEENGIDVPLALDLMTSEEKAKARKIAAGVRKQIGDDPAVSLEVQKIRQAEGAKKLAEAVEAATKAPSAFKPIPA